MAEATVPFTVIGGYLGAGKTTLLNHLLRHARGRRFAVLVNDFGAINIDARLIRSQDDQVMRLDNGCLCCNLAGGLAEALHRLMQEQPRPEHVVVEASGVADPVRIGHYAHVAPFRPDGVLVMVDCETIRERSRDPFVGDAVTRQLRGADLLILNKVDLVSEETLVEVSAWIRELVPGARVLPAVQAEVAPELLLGLTGPGLAASAAGETPATPPHATAGVEIATGEAAANAAAVEIATGEAAANAAAANRDAANVDAATGSTSAATGWKFQGHQTEYSSWTLSSPRAWPEADFREQVASWPEAVLRAKGFVHLQEHPHSRYLFQLVGRRFSLTPEGDWEGPPRTELVLIGLAGQVDGPSLLRSLEATR